MWDMTVENGVRLAKRWILAKLRNMQAALGMGANFGSDAGTRETK